MRQETEIGHDSSLAASASENSIARLKVNVNADQNYGSDGVKMLFEQYKIYVDSASKVSDRRGAANTFLLTANTGLVAIYGLVAGKEAALGSGSWGWLAPLAGLTICTAWFALIRAYRALNAAKFKVIHELEGHFPAQLYNYEWEQLTEGRARNFTRLTHVEQFVPFLFGLIYAGLAIAALV